MTKYNPLKEMTSSEIVEHLLELDVMKCSEVFQAIGLIFRDAEKRARVISEQRSRETYEDFVRRLSDPDRH